MESRDTVFNRFESEVRCAGFRDVFEYKGRFNVVRPAIKCKEEELYHVKRSTSMDIGWEKMGFGIVVYPK